VNASDEFETLFWGGCLSVIASSCIGAFIGSHFLGPFGSVIGLILAPFVLFYSILFTVLGFVGLRDLREWFNNWKVG